MSFRNPLRGSYNRLTQRCVKQGNQNLHARKLSTFGALCTTIVDTHIERGILLNPQFDIVGLAPTFWQCKGLAQHPACPNPLPDFVLWDRWVDHYSPNIRVVLASMVPNLVQKVLTLACTDLRRQVDLASLIRGFCYKRYAKAWWWTHLRSTLIRYH